MTRVVFTPTTNGSHGGEPAVSKNKEGMLGQEHNQEHAGDRERRASDC